MSGMFGSSCGGRSLDSGGGTDRPREMTVVPTVRGVLRTGL